MTPDLRELLKNPTPVKCEGCAKVRRCLEAGPGPASPCVIFVKAPADPAGKGSDERL